jgi:hypothetical protein
MMVHSQFRIYTFLLIVLLLLSFSSLASAQNTPADVGVFESPQVAPGAVVQVPVSVRNVTGLYGMDVSRVFDPAVVQVEDSNPSSSGIQVGLGTFLDPGLLLYNQVDNQAGTIRFAMSQVNPSEAKSGQGILLVVTFSGVKEGQSPLDFTSIMLGNRDGVEIPSQAVNSALLVKAGAPTQAATYPVADETGIIVVNTLTPTPIPSPTEIPTETPVPTLAEAVQSPTTAMAAGTTQQAVQSPTVAATAPAEDASQPGYFLVENWWILLILLAAVIGAAVYYFKTKKTGESKEDNL